MHKALKMRSQKQQELIAVAQNYADLLRKQIGPLTESFKWRKNPFLMDALDYGIPLSERDS